MAPPPSPPPRTAKQSLASAEKLLRRCRSTAFQADSGCVVHGYSPLVEQLQQKIAKKELFFSMEFFPPRTCGGAAALLNKIEKMDIGKPLFIDITWHPSGDPAGDTETSSMMIANAALNYCGVETMLHMTCCGITLEQIDLFVKKAKALGLRNILALRGDPPIGQEKWQPQPGGFNYAVDLVEHIRKREGSHFTIGIAGYPDGHPECTSYADDLQHLKEKADAGADVIITQLFFDAATFIRYVTDCRALGITIPIIPGILPIQSAASLRHLVKLSKLAVPRRVQEVVDANKGNDEAIRQYGIHEAVAVCKALLEADVAPGFHFYTLNRTDATFDILKQLHLWNDHMLRPLPWCKQSAHHKRTTEAVRPVFWMHRPKSYIQRSFDWEQYPVGRWAGMSSPLLYKDVSDYHAFYLNCGNELQDDNETLQMLGSELGSELDVWQVFYCYLTGIPNKQGRKVTYLPWHEKIELAPETDVIVSDLAELNANGILTINSQPNVNGVDSNHPVFGWGRPNGYIYQKAYVEFFIPPDRIDRLLKVLDCYPLVNFQITNYDGSEEETNCFEREPIALTWGVFPGTEIQQPTVVDPASFRYWRTEAYDLWKYKWADLYPENSRSRLIIEHIQRTYYLCYIVDNEFPKQTCLFELLKQVISNEPLVVHGNNGCAIEKKETRSSLSSHEDEDSENSRNS